MPIEVTPVGDAFGWKMQFRFYGHGMEYIRVYSGAGQHTLAEWLAFAQDPNGVLSAELWRKDGLLYLGDPKPPDGQLVIAEHDVLALIRCAVADAQKAGMLYV